MKGESNLTVDDRQVFPEYRISLVVFKSICILLGVSGNLLVIIHNVFIRYEKNPSTFFTTNLAIADLLACLTIYPIRIARSFIILQGSEALEENDNGLFLCKFHYFSGCFSVSLSTLTLLAVTYDRYLFIKKPLKYPLLMTTPKVYAIILAIWLTSLIYLPLAISYVETSERTIINGCFFEADMLSALLLLYIYLPVLIILWLNFLKLRIARTQRCSIARNSIRDASVANINITTRIAKELKAVRTFAVIMGLLVICYTPFAIVVVFDLLHYHPGLPRLAFNFFADLVGINLVFNPIIYCIRHKEYRKAIRRCCSALCC